MRFFLILTVTFFFGAACGASAQVAVEYGVIGSKTPPKSADISETIEKRVDEGTKQAGCSGNRCVKKQTPQSKNTARTREHRVTKNHSGQRATGPLIIEQRGDRYERIQ